MTEQDFHSQPAASSRPRVWRRVLVLLAALAALALLLRLGFWQLDRALEKQAMQGQLEASRRLPALDLGQLTEQEASAAAQAQRQVRLNGRWVSDKTVFLDNRTMATRVGFYVLTPLVLEDGSSVLVQRGWQPRNASERTAMADFASPAGPVQVLGQLLLEPSRMYSLGGPERGAIRQNIDLPAFARETGLALRPVVVLEQASSQNSGDGLQRHWPQPAVDLHKNYGYAFQWFALAALVTGLYVWYQIFNPRRKARLKPRQKDDLGGH